MKRAEEKKIGSGESSSGSAGTRSVSPRSTSTIAFLKTTRAGIYLRGELRLNYNVACAFIWFFFPNRNGAITVLYPSLADWSESPPYSTLPRPGVEPLENNRQPYSCVFHVANTPGRQADHMGCSFCSNRRNYKVGQFEETASGRGWERWTRSDGAARRMCLRRICWSRSEGKDDFTENQSNREWYSWTLTQRCQEAQKTSRSRGRWGSVICQTSNFPFRPQSVRCWLLLKKERSHVIPLRPGPAWGRCLAPKRPVFSFVLLQWLSASEWTIKGRKGVKCVLRKEREWRWNP